MHDTRLDRAASVAMALPSAVVGYIALDALTSKRGDHVHTDIITGSKNHLKVGNHRLQPRSENDKEYVQTRRLVGSDDNDIIWPSV